ncbi:MAG: GerMN domain-containing protein [Treponemataceae bacterium]|nr:GerMN domain-containing protein [Treponemataceae bacterium]
MGGKKSKKHTSGLALACWLVGFLVLLIVFLVKLDDIKSNLKSTRFFERVFGTTPTFIEHYEEKKPVAEPLPEEDVVITLNTVPPAQVEPPVTSVPSDEPRPPVQPPANAAEKPMQQPTVPREQTPPAPVTPPADEKPAIATSTAKLYFVSIDNDGSVTRKEMARTVTRNDSPLTGNITLLLAGPNPSERGKGCRSLIPDGTRLLSATVRDGVAVLNFSEEFEYNRVGVEGYIGQLMQIVYTATEFPTVNSVQFLIDGERKEYLGSEGVWIGSPLSRSSF